MSDSQLYTYDDVELYTYCHFDGKEAWVIDKGDHVSDHADGRHLLLEVAGKDNEVRLHERLVNRYLRERYTLWVDFTDNLAPV